MFCGFVVFNIITKIHTTAIQVILCLFLVFVQVWKYCWIKWIISYCHDGCWTILLPKGQGPTESTNETVLMIKELLTVN